MKEKYRDYKARVRSYACDNWSEILQATCGLTEQETTPSKKGIPCPNCGGVDRYEFKSPENGFYLCRGCEAGDGFSLIMKMHKCTFSKAVEKVARYLGVEKQTYRNLAEARAEQQRIAAMIEANKMKREQRQAEREEETIKKQKKAAQEAVVWLEYAKPADRKHKYLTRKRLSPKHLGVLQSGNNLLIPLFTKGHKLVNLEHITPDGSKFGLKGGVRKGVYHRIGGDLATRFVYVCEGWATAASLYMMGNKKVRVYAAMGKGNLEAVARIAKG